MDNLNVPFHMAIILDGNGRWATKRGLARSDGHTAGFKNLQKIVPYIAKKGVKYLSVFAFSTENFKRSEREVSFLMNLFINKFKSEMSFYKKENIKVIFSGRKSLPLPKGVIKVMEDLEKETFNNTGLVFNVCLNYGGQSEIVDAAKSFARSVLNGTDINSLDEKGFYKYLYQDLPPIDFLIRTSGEVRISNFMLYSLAYAEMYFPDVYFPDFNEEEIDKAIFKYNSRDRRFGGIKNEKKSS